MASSATGLPPSRSVDLADLPADQRRRVFWAYGLGDVGTGMGAALIGFYLLRFYVAAGLPPWLAGLAYGIGRLWDAINDPIVGWLSDKTSAHPWGPRIPWMLWSTSPDATRIAIGFGPASYVIVIPIIRRDKSSVDDFDMKPGSVRMRVGFVLRSAEL